MTLQMPSAILQYCLMQEMLDDWERRCQFDVASFWIEQGTGVIIASAYPYDPGTSPAYMGWYGDEVMAENRELKDHALSRAYNSSRIRLGDRDADPYPRVQWSRLIPLAYKSRYGGWALTETEVFLPYGVCQK